MNNMPKLFRDIFYLNFVELSTYYQQFRNLNMCKPRKKVLRKKIQLINVKDDFQSVLCRKIAGKRQQTSDERH